MAENVTRASVLREFAMSERMDGILEFHAIEGEPYASTRLLRMADRIAVLTQRLEDETLRATYEAGIAEDAIAHAERANAERDAARKDAERVLRLLCTVMEYCDTKVLDHDCEFGANPERGECDVCAAWGELYGMYAARAAEERTDG